MLKDDNRVLGSRSGTTIYVFKSQVVDSYIELNSANYHYLTIGVSGLSATTPLKVYYVAPTGTQKDTLSSDSGGWQPSYTASNETSYKKWFFFGKLTGLYSLQFTNTYSYQGSRYRGDLIRLMEQFPILSTLVLPPSQFNKNISNATLPTTLKVLTLNDNTLSGEINTIKNFEKIQQLSLTDCTFTKNLSDINFTNLTRLYLYNLYSLRGNINDIVTKNSNFNYWYMWNCPLWSGSTTTLDVSKLIYLYWYTANTPKITGNFTNWTFNTGITNVTLYTSYFGGNMTNWNFSNTKLSALQIQNYGYSNNAISGSLSGWTLPSTLTQINLYYCSGLTSIPQNYSTCPNFNSLYVYYSPYVVGNINDFSFNNKLNSIQINYTQLHGNLEIWKMPTGGTSLLLQNSRFTGNLSGITTGTTLSKTIYQLNFDGNRLKGEMVGWNRPTTLQYLTLSRNSGITMNFNLGTFNTGIISQLYIDAISGITGDFSNLVIPNNMSLLSFQATRVNCDLSKLDVRKVSTLYAQSCTGMYGNLSNWRITGTTNLTTMYINSNVLLSGSTANWNVNNIYDLRINNTALSGALKHNNVQYLYAHSTKITSNIRTDFNFSNRGYYIALNNSNITGSLSGVTINFGVQAFYVYSCSGLTGSNAFTNYLFVNRKNWTYTYPNFYWHNIGDNVTGATENLGDLGTYPSGGTNYQWNLTENEVNNLVAGTDYTGTGTNTPWNSKQKIYWMKNAKISSTNLNRRYVQFNLVYS